MSDDKNSPPSKRAKMAQALEQERESYLRAGNKDRVAQVEASIRALRGEPPVGRRTPRSTQSEA